ncbi:Asp-tRNA(Asn)/Glu-tRNA(Gln) amidotransferase subunit GatB [Candidatus Roizmanbacteria bacterium]|nr:Asp-tRNA(Asn)/Glu-tRNA(Gln) amidotransferase subunit GatB [Candidatus Roizmanbacteria bacterium]
MKYIPVIGLEIHVELKTASKMFCQCSADYFAKPPNSNTCPVCLGMPGALPVPNETAVNWTMKIGKALNCQLASLSKFDRKHYFYPDLPKGYQISQYVEPIAVNGYLKLKGKKFRVQRVHLEEDTGKLIHSGKDTLVDFNRSGVPLVEIVTEPDFDNSNDVKEFLQELHTIIKYLDVSDADMEKGSMRLEPNISVRVCHPGLDPGSQKDSLVHENDKLPLPPYKVEVKNINSFNFVKKAIDYEVKRHLEILEKGETPIQETRGFVEADSSTKSQRSKEETHDYRYFPDPDIPPLSFSADYLSATVGSLPELPAAKTNRFIKKFGLKEADAFLLTRDKEVAGYFEKCLTLVKGSRIVEDLPQKLANAILNKRVTLNLGPDKFVQSVVELYKPKATDMEKLDAAVKSVLAKNQSAVEEYKKGKERVIMFLVGQVMREMKGQADPLKVKKELAGKLKR